LIVVDTSAIVSALAASPVDPDLLARLSNDNDLHAPHLIDVEILNALRRLVATGRLTEERASDARADFADLTILRYPHHPLADRMWELRHNITAYDAAFVALGEVLDAPVVTCDGRLAAASGHNAAIELFEP
jgi:predicted nucleic acid-binding protein